MKKGDYRKLQEAKELVRYYENEIEEVRLKRRQIFIKNYERMGRIEHLIFENREALVNTPSYDEITINYLRRSYMSILKVKHRYKTAK